jgi:hypothetical protein
MAMGRGQRATTRKTWGRGANVHIAAALFIVKGCAFQLPELKRLINIHTDVQGRKVNIHLGRTPDKRFAGRMRAGRSGGGVGFAFLKQETF